MFYKEKIGKKPNTLRRKDLDDERHLMLGAMMATDDYGFIEIESTFDREVFKRQITDVTEWDGWLIISWEHEEGS